MQSPQTSAHRHCIPVGAGEERRRGGRRQTNSFEVTSRHFVHRGPRIKDVRQPSRAGVASLMFTTSRQCPGGSPLRHQRCSSGSCPSTDERWARQKRRSCRLACWSSATKGSDNKSYMWTRGAGQTYMCNTITCQTPFLSSTLTPRFIFARLVSVINANSSIFNYKGELQFGIAV